MIQSEDHNAQVRIEHIKVVVKDYIEEVVDGQIQEIEIVHHHQMIQHKKHDVVNDIEEMKVMIL